MNYVMDFPTNVLEITRCDAGKTSCADWVL